MNTQGDVYSWRRRLRRKLLNARGTIGADFRSDYSARIEEVVSVLLRRRGASRIGFYWPIRGEVDLRPLMREVVSRGGCAALPAVIERHSPLEFRRWWPGMPLYPDAHGVPAPKWRDLIDPDVLLIPMVGFDQDLFRLGFGAGYLDRTLAALEPKPFCIGISYELCRLNTIFPQPHDIPLDAVVTEDRVRTRRDRVTAPESDRTRPVFASPPCYAAELDANYQISD